MKFKKHINSFITPNHLTEKDGIFFWQERVLLIILTASSVLGFITYLPSISLAVKEKLWSIAVLDTLMLGLIFFLTWRKDLPYKFRAASLSLISFILGVVLLAVLGSFGAGPIWLFTFPIFTLILMGNRSAFAALFINLMTLIFIGFVIQFNIDGIIGLFKINTWGLSTENHLEKWVVICFNFMLLNIITVLIMAIVLGGLNKSLIKSASAERKYREIFDNILDVYFETSLDGKIIEISPSIEKISDYSQEELKENGVLLSQIYDQTSQGTDLIDKLKQTAQTQNYEIYLKNKTGSTRICSVNAKILDDKDGKPPRIVGILRDITESKKDEQEKIKAQKITGEREKLALVGQIAGKIAHDFNNILGIIMGNTELALPDCQEPETRKSLEIIFKQTIRGKNLTKNLLAFAKDQEPRQEFFSFNEKVDLVLNLLKKDLEYIKIILEKKSGLPDIFADPGMIEHTIVNLIQNSIHALSKVKNPTIIIKTYAANNNIYLEIEDNGCGIPKEHLENIYEPSFTLKGNKDTIKSYETGTKGTGYGMTNVKKYIEQHKGSIFVESELGSGTKFIIKIPVIKKALTAKEKIELKEEIAHLEKNILLVEDEQSLSDVQYRILTQPPFNHKVDIAINGEVAVDLFDRNKYDLVSLDYVFPGKISGMDVYNHIRKTDQTIPVLFISGNIEFLESLKILKQKDAYIDHLSKPCQNKDYVKAINSLLEKH